MNVNEGMALNTMIRLENKEKICFSLNFNLQHYELERKLETPIDGFHL